MSSSDDEIVLEAEVRPAFLVDDGLTMKTLTLVTLSQKHPLPYAFIRITYTPNAEDVISSCTEIRDVTLEALKRKLEHRGSLILNPVNLKSTGTPTKSSNR